MKKTITYRMLSILCVLTLVLACVPASRAEGKKVTVMVYMCGSNLESQNMEATQSLGQMIRSHFNTEDVNVAVFAGGSAAWNNGFDANKLTLGEVGNSRRIQTEEFDLAPMGDPETLTFFLNECASRYPAEENILIFWDHGGGPAHGVCQDELFRGDTLSLTEIASALAASPFADHGLDLVVFNACLMGSAELSVVLAPYAKYLIATEDSMYGLTYDWLAGAETRTVSENAKKIVDDSYAFNEEVIENQHASEINSFSVVDLSRAKALSDAVDAFFAHITPDLDKMNFTAMSAQRRDSVTFGVGESGNASGFDLVDLGDLVQHYRESAPAEADALITALKEAVVYHRSAMPECTGLTVYHPFENKNENLLMYRIAVYNGLGFAPAYTTYIQRFASLLTGTKLADWTGLRLAASAKKDQRTLYTMTLTDEQAAHFGTAKLTGLVKDTEHTYCFTWAGDQFTLENNVLTAEYVHTSLCLTDSEGNPIFYPLNYTRDTRGNYLIPAELTRHEKKTEEGTLPEISRKALISCAYDPESRKMEPGGVLVWDEGMAGYTPAFNSVYTDYDEMKLTLSSRAETRDDDGALLPYDQWTVSYEDEYSVPIDGTKQFMLLPDLFGDENLAVAFLVTDSQNNRYLSDLLPVGTAPQAADLVTEYDDAKLILINNLSLQPANGYLSLNINLSNLTDTEAIVALKKLTLNGKSMDISVEAYGNGENWGLLPGESTLLPCSVPLENLRGIDTLTALTFDLVSTDAADPRQVLGTVPVRITTTLDLTNAQ